MPAVGKSSTNLVSSVSFSGNTLTIASFIMLIQKNLYFDADGCGVGLQGLFINFANQTSLTAADFYVY